MIRGTRLSMEYRVLGRTGLKVPVISFGASPLGGVFRPVLEADGIKTVRAALELGMNFFDVSPYYGKTLAETVLGNGLKGVPRQSYIVATKLGRYDENLFDFSAARVARSIDESLQRLGVDHVDIIQAHDIEFGDLNQVVTETIPAMRELVRKGKARFVGITGLPLKVFEYVISRVPIDTILSYCHYSLNDRGLETLLGLCEQKGIGVINASPLSMGLLSQKGPPSWHPATEEIKAACRRAAEVAGTAGVDIAEIAVKWSIREKRIATTLIGMADVEHLRRNMQWCTEPLDEVILKKIQATLQPVLNKTWPSGRPENN